MKAVICTRYGPPDVLQLTEVDKPVPKDKEVLIKIYATTVTAGDCELRRFDLPAWIWLPMRLYTGFFKPRIKILGQEMAGIIESVGEQVTKFKKGDIVFAPSNMKLGAYAGFKILPENYMIAMKPDAISYEVAATIPTGGLNALHFLRKANIQPGQQLLINGSGGSIGTYAIQIAKNLGAEVTAVDSTVKLDKLLAIGADYVIDYTKEDFSKSAKKYDAVIDIVGKRSFARCVRALKKNGTCIMGNPRLSGAFRGLWVSMISGKKVKPAIAGYKTEDLNYLAEQIVTGKIKPLIDKCFPLEQMQDAHRYVESGNKTGNLVITVEHNN